MFLILYNVSSAVTAPSSPKYSSYMSEFDLTDLDQLDIRSRNNSNGRYVKNLSNNIL